MASECRERVKVRESILSKYQDGIPALLMYKWEVIMHNSIAQSLMQYTKRVVQNIQIHWKICVIILQYSF
jgi:hypothetical protein